MKNALLLCLFIFCGCAGSQEEASRIKMIVCGEYPNTNVIYILEKEEFDTTNCTVVAIMEVVGGTDNTVPVPSFLEHMKTACPECSDKISGFSSGPCPHCLRADGGCASVCAEAQ